MICLTGTDDGAVKSTVLIRLAAEDSKGAKGRFTISRTPSVPANSLDVRPDRRVLLKE